MPSNFDHRNQNHPLSQRMQAYLERLQSARNTLFEEAGKKRPAPTDLAKGPESAKKPRIDQSAVVVPGPVSVAQIFTLTSDPGVQNFDVTKLPNDIVVKILLPLLKSVDPSALGSAVNVSLFV
jgi:symplekin